jgi:phospholipase A1/A2
VQLFNFSFLSLLILFFASVSRAEQVGLGDDKNAATELEKRTARSVMAYKPIYMAYGNQLTKIQFSFRSQVIDDKPLNFAYTQIIFWQLSKKSAPFLDATYNPELFYRKKMEGPLFTSLDFGIWEHNSNGKDGVDSRSYDQSYLRGSFEKDWTRIATVFSVKFKIIYSNDNTNHDIQDYLGPVDFDMVVLRLLENSILDQAELILGLRAGGRYGTELSQGGYQIAATFHIKDLNVNPAFYIQYYHGYAETLINYNQKVDSLRFGLAF